MADAIQYKIKVKENQLRKCIPFLDNFDKVVLTGMEEFGKVFTSDMKMYSPVGTGKMKKSWHHTEYIRGNRIISEVVNDAVRPRTHMLSFPYPLVVEHTGWFDRRGNFHRPLLHEKIAIPHAIQSMNDVVKNKVHIVEVK
jgi:hypothetical protein